MEVHFDSAGQRVSVLPNETTAGGVEMLNDMATRATLMTAIQRLQSLLTKTVVAACPGRVIDLVVQCLAALPTETIATVAEVQNLHRALPNPMQNAVAPPHAALAAAIDGVQKLVTNSAVATCSGRVIDLVVQCLVVLPVETNTAVLKVQQLRYSSANPLIDGHMLEASSPKDLVPSFEDVIDFFTTRFRDHEAIQSTIDERRITFMGASHIPVQEPFAIVRYASLLSANGSSHRNINCHLIPIGALDARTVVMLRRIAGLLHEVRHPNLLEYVGVGAKDGHMFVATECLDTCTLRDILQTESLNVQSILYFLYNVAKGMQHLHQLDIIHRTLSTQCVYVVVSTGEAKIGNFEFCRQDARLDTKSVMGISPYAAPEILMGTTNYTKSVDVYSFAMRTPYLFQSRRDVVHHGAMSSHC
ncbi:TKL protein kinase [Saprolegnia diclina VS20]|uniref:TKL protein kinase n=1 Tax=Saprolegnia diclina (strain VS20) TaxID=1156394 RepID=T0RGM0_SAPDV|nr:TKL protein kinase [Saprolegnia diclina VS20]EQC28867.1 TKL protein kinase [Saprolegnia diclina VS20]|eukprot:XP_008617684.1 TKL protein kinase [Saprolegnia diclina VS20]